MSILPAGRKGKNLLVKHRPVEFSRWPVFKKTRRFGLQPVLFASNPWSIIRDRIRNDSLASVKPEALAFVDQSEDYFRAATQSATVATKPVLMYYSFLNLAKAFVLHKRTLTTITVAKHGLSEHLPVGGAELTDAYLEVFKTGSTVNVFDAFYLALTGTHSTASKKTINVVELLPQILQGHRIWCGMEAETERFISIERIRIINDSAARSMWLALYFNASDLARLSVSRKNYSVLPA